MTDADAINKIKDLEQQLSAAKFDNVGLQIRITQLEAALEPLANKWLHPEDMYEGALQEYRSDPDWTQKIEDDGYDYLYIKYLWIRAARKALGRV